MNYYAWNDSLVEQIVKDDRYDIRQDGTVWRKAGLEWRQTGNAKTNKRGKEYRHLKYRGQMILVHRIVYQKFFGLIDSSLVINHIDGNSLNNAPANLEMITQHENVIHAHHG